MTKYTAEDFARAEFARHEDVGLAARTDPEDTHPWAAGPGWTSDAEMAAASGWSIVRDADTMTPREHLDAAWEKAHEVDVIPAGAGYVTKWDNGDFEAILEGSRPGKPSRGPVFERRLLDPPAPAWHNARIIEMGGRQWARREDPSRGVEWVALSGLVSQCATPEIAAYGDVTVIVGDDT